MINWSIDYILYMSKIIDFYNPGATLKTLYLKLTVRFHLNHGAYNNGSITYFDPLSRQSRLIS